MFRYVTTITTGDSLNLTDLTLGQVGSRVVLLGSTHDGGGMTRWNVAGAGDVPAFVATYDYVDKLTHMAEPQAVLLQRPDGAAAILPAGLYRAGEVASTLFADSAKAAPDLALIRSHLPRDLLDAGSFTNAAGRSLVWTVRHEHAELSLWRQGADGVLTPAVVSTAPPGIPSDAQIDSIAVVRIGGIDLILSASTRGNFISAHVVTPEGGLSSGQILASAGGSGFNGPRDIVAVEVEGKHYAVVSSAYSSSLTTLRIVPGGGLVPVDHILDERATRFHSATVMEAVEVNGRSFLVVGGADDGLSLFTLTPDGRLLHLETIADTAATALADVSALALRAINGKIVVFAASATEGGVSQFVIDPGAVGVTRHVSDGAFIGTSGNDLIQGGPGTARIDGGRGDDILIGGVRPIAMAGGAGADTFVPTAVAGTVTIKDFEPGHDRLDLSMMGMIRSSYQLGFTTQPWGITIRAGVTRIDIHRSGGGSLSATIFTDAMFPVAHYQPPDVRSTILGTAAGDVLTASAGGSWIYGYTGNDTILGSQLEDYILAGPGHDRIVAADGDDTIWSGDGNDLIRAGGMDDLILAGNDHDFVMGEGGDDRIAGQKGNDILFGGSGRDRLNGGSGDDFLAGEDGDDRIFGLTGNDRLLGGAGNDIMLDVDGDNIFRDSGGNTMMFAGGGRDRMFAGTGADTIRSGAGNDFVAGGDGNDNMMSAAGDDIVLGEGGNDLILGVGGQDWLHGGGGNDTIWGGDDADRLAGSDGNDVLMGESGNDVLLGGSGDDTARGHGGSDKLFMGSGNDRALGGIGEDTIAGDDGNDLILGDGGRDVLIGGAGNDTIDGGIDDDDIWASGGDDLVIGGLGDDRMRGGMGNDTMAGGGGADRLNGQAGNDSLAGENGNDLIIGDWGNDVLKGDDGNDTLSGGGDADVLIGGAGLDVLTGGSGRDVFSFLAVTDSEGGCDTITDFVAGEDRIDLSDIGILTVVGAGRFGGTPMELAWRMAGNGLRIIVDVDGDYRFDLQIQLDGVTAISAHDFLI